MGSDIIIWMLKEMVDGKRGLNSGMRAILTDVRNLFSFSDGKLTEAMDTLRTLHANTTSNTGRLAQNRRMREMELKLSNEAITFVVMQKKAIEKETYLIINWRDAVYQADYDVQDFFDEIESLIEDDDVQDFYDAFNDLRDAASNYPSQIAKVCSSCTE